MDSGGSISNELLESVRGALGRHVRLGLRRVVNLETRPDKTEERILVMSKFRAYILGARVPTRLESSFHFLDINSIESKTTDLVAIVCDTRSYKLGGVGDFPNKDVDDMITHIATSLKHTFPQFPVCRFIQAMDLEPAARQVIINEKVSSFNTQENGPCGGFSQVYECMCDYYGMESRAEVAWDIDTIYMSHNCKELRLRDFDHLRTRDLIPIISALEHNTWFTKFNTNGLKLVTEKPKSNDAAIEVAKIMERNSHLEEIRLSNTGIKFDFIQKLSTSVLNNSGSQLTSLDLSHNVLDDRGAIQLATAINKLPKGLVYLDLTNTGMTSKGLNKLCDVMNGKQNITDNLKTLILADNAIKVDDVASVYTFLAQPTSLTHLDISGTDLPLDMLSGAMIRGCCHTLTHLNLSRNPFTTKRAKEIVVPKSWNQLFTSFYALQTVKLSGCRLPPDALRDMLTGISDNLNLCDLDLDISSNELRSPGAKVLDTCLSQLKNVCSLNLSDNGFDSDIIPVLVALEKNSTIRRLSIGQNFAGIKSRNLSEALDMIVRLIQSDDCCIEHLSVADSKLRSDTAIVINSMSGNSSISDLDISGNLMGNFGARMLSKALQINKTLVSVNADRNNITAQGYDDIANALQQNYTMKHFPMPVSDLANAVKLDASRTQSAIHKIEKYIQRNHSPRKYVTDSEFRLHQLFLVSPLQHMIGKLVVQIEGQLKTLDVGEDHVQATQLIKEADTCRQLLPSLQQIAIKSQEGTIVHSKLSTFFTELKSSLQTHLQETADEMLKAAKSQCAAIMTSVSSEELDSDIVDKSHIEESFIKDLLDNISLGLFNKISEVNLSVAAHISDFVTDQLIDSLKTTHSTLSYRQRQSKVVPAVRDVSESNDSLDNLDATVEAPKKASLRVKSERKKRPNSVFVPEDERDDIPELTDQNDPNNTKADLIDGPDPNVVVTPTTAPLPALTSLTTLPTITTNPSLTHLVKDRPRRPKMHATSRPMVKPMNLISENEINGEATEAEVASLATSNAEARTSTDSLTESDDGTDRKKDRKQRVSIPKIGSTLGQGLSQGISNFFGRKKPVPKKETAAEKPIIAAKSEPTVESSPPKSDDSIKNRAPIAKTDDVIKPVETAKPEESTTSDDVTREDRSRSSSEEKLEVEDQPKRPMKPPAGMPKMGFGNDIMSQLKNRQAGRKSDPDSNVIPHVSPKPTRKFGSRHAATDSKTDSAEKPKDVPDSAKPNLIKSDSAKSNSIKSDSTKVELAKPNPIKSDSTPKRDPSLKTSLTTPLQKADDLPKKHEITPQKSDASPPEKPDSTPPKLPNSSPPDSSPPDKPVTPPQNAVATPEKCDSAPLATSDSAPTEKPDETPPQIRKSGPPPRPESSPKPVVKDRPSSLKKTDPDSEAKPVLRSKPTPAENGRPTPALRPKPATRPKKPSVSAMPTPMTGNDERTSTSSVSSLTDKPVDKPTDAPDGKPVDQPPDKPVDKPANKPVDVSKRLSVKELTQQIDAEKKRSSKEVVTDLPDVKTEISPTAPARRKSKRPPSEKLSDSLTLSQTDSLLDSLTDKSETETDPHNNQSDCTDSALSQSDDSLLESDRRKSDDILDEKDDSLDDGKDVKDNKEDKIGLPDEEEDVIFI